MYGHPVYFAETFIDRSRYRGTCYRAANWQYLGQTQGRGKDDLTHQREPDPQRHPRLAAVSGLSRTPAACARSEPQEETATAPVIENASDVERKRICRHRRAHSRGAERRRTREA